MFLLKIWMHSPNREFTSIYQGGIRFNSYLGLAVAQLVFGDEGLTIAAVLIAFMIPTINVLYVLILSVYGSDSKPAVAMALVLWSGLDGIPASMIVIFAGLPTASSAFHYPLTVRRNYLASSNKAK